MQSRASKQKGATPGIVRSGPGRLDDLAHPTLNESSDDPLPRHGSHIAPAREEDAQPVAVGGLAGKDLTERVEVGDLVHGGDQELL